MDFISLPALCVFSIASRIIQMEVCPCGKELNSNAMKQHRRRPNCSLQQDPLRSFLQQRFLEASCGLKTRPLTTGAAFFHYIHVK